jgi:hypothetical protein
MNVVSRADAAVNAELQQIERAAAVVVHQVGEPLMAVNPEVADDALAAAGNEQPCDQRHVASQHAGMKVVGTSPTDLKDVLALTHRARPSQNFRSCSVRRSTNRSF